MTIFADDFNRADNSDINSGAPVTWAEMWAAITRWSIVSNQLQETTAAFAPRYIYPDSACATLVQYAEVTLVNGAAGNNTPGVMVGADAGAGTGYCAYWNYSNNTLRLIRFSGAGGVETNINTLGSSHANGDILRLEWTQSTGDLVVKVNGSTVLTGNDTTYTAGTRVGIRGGEGNITFDDFSGGDLSVGGSGPFPPFFKFEPSTQLRM